MFPHPQPVNHRGQLVILVVIVWTAYLCRSKAPLSRRNVIPEKQFVQQTENLKPKSDELYTYTRSKAKNRAYGVGGWWCVPASNILAQNKLPVEAKKKLKLTSVTTMR